MARKIPGEFVPLDLDLPRDIKIRKAGPDAELLYIRGLIYLKAADYDGFIPDFDIPALAVGCKAVPASIKRLLTVGLWEPSELDGMAGYYCRAWLKWNMSRAELEEQRAQRKIGALKTNHDRGLHKEERHPECPKCRKEDPDERPQLAAL